jgi:hypothetical protein
MSYPLTRHDARAEHDGEFAGLVQRVAVDGPRLPLAAPVADEAAAKFAQLSDGALLDGQGTWPLVIGSW